MSIMSVNQGLFPPGAAPPSSIQLNPDQLISPDALMAYCASRLRGIDDQVHQAFAAQEKCNADQKALGDMSQWLHSYCPGGADGSIHADADRAFQNAIDALGPTTQAGRELAACKADFMNRVDHGSISPDDIEKVFVQKIKDISGEVSGGAELNMINLQSLMSQRQMAVQLTTNLIQTMGEMTNKVVANIHG
jgi:hypothetical protein